MQSRDDGGASSLLLHPLSSFTFLVSRFSPQAPIAITKYKGAVLYQNQLAYTDGDLITASDVAPLEFACEILKKLNVYTPSVLDAWYHLPKTGEPAYFFALVEAVRN